MLDAFQIVKRSRPPEAMTRELEVWLDVMLNGSTTPPLRLAQEPLSVKTHILGVASIQHPWADAGQAPWPR